MRNFGVTADGRTVHAAALEWPGGLQVEVLEFGAVVRRLRVPTPGGPRDVVLNLDALEDYERDTAYIGAVVGRVANRIADGRFTLDGHEVQIEVNEPPNTLHGGRVGFNKRVWRLQETAEDGRSATLTYVSPDGEAGFPGGVEVQARYALVAADTLEIAYEAQADAPTTVNLSQHLYFNLLGDRASTILDHRLQVAADRFTPVDAALIPTGELAAVDGRPFDFRDGKAVQAALAGDDAQLALAGGIDLNWALTQGEEPALRLVAPDGLWLELRTDQPGVQIYSGHKLTPPFIRYGALAIEPQGFPDAVNHPAFPSVVLRPGETYRHTSRYRFGI
jgi:aldose 1-epimerase